MIIENIVAQMLKSKGHRLFYYSNSSRDDVAFRMKIDFLIAKDKISRRHNISPIEVKSGNNYTTKSLNKFQEKYKNLLDKAYIIHTGNLKVTDNIIYLPLYMTELL